MEFLTLTGTRDNGVLTLNGSAPNASVESNLTFDGNILTAIGSGNYQAAISGSTAAAYTQLYINGTGRAYGIGVGNASETTYGVPNEFFLFDHNAAAMRLVVDANGNVGIGTASPINRLQVAGNVSASSYTSSVSNGVGFFGTASFAQTGSVVANALTFSNTGNGAATGTTYNGSVARTISYNSVGAVQGTQTAYSTIASGSSGDWFPLFTMSEATNGPVYCSVNTYAHSSVSFIAVDGYGPSNFNHIVILGNVWNANSGYANISGVRITDAGVVQIRLTWTTGPLVDIDVALTCAGVPPTLSANLSVDNSGTINDSVDLTTLNGYLRTENGYYGGTNLLLNANGSSYFNGGNVGIGTTSPVNKLQIAGNVSASSYTSSVLNGVGFLGTSSVASTSISSSYALTSSYALNAGAGAGFPFSGNAVITGSLNVVTSTGGLGGITGSFSGSGAGLTDLPVNFRINRQTFVGNGSTQNYILSQSYLSTGLVVTVGGLRYVDTNDYTLSGTTLQFVQAPASNSIIVVDAFVNSPSGSAGTFSGSLIGTASFATTASFASNVLKTKAGSIAFTAFAGTPYSASVTFSTSFANTNFAVVVTGEDARSWTIQNKTAGGFTVNSNSNTVLTGTTYWTCTAYGEN